MILKQRKIIGHKKQFEIISKSINSNKVFPVWIFWGTDGIGKTSIAYKFAKCLLADLNSVNETLDLPEDNKVHNLVENRTHPDFFVLDKESPTIDDIRTIIEKVGKASSLSTRRVVIIENADHLNKNMYNSLLKILEEPPSNTVFILICNNLGNLPITLLSRAIKLKFNPLSNREVQLALTLFNVDDIDILVQIADGSIGHALYLYENNGIELYQNLIKAFSSDYATANKIVKYIIDNKFTSNFLLVKLLIFRVLKIYIDTIAEINIHSSFENMIGKVSVDHETAKVLNIISDVNRGESLLLDKNGMIAEIFETFFERNKNES